MKEPNPTIEHGGKLWRFNNGGGGPLYGYTALNNTYPSGTPWINWRGSKLPHHWWQKMLAFFRWTYERPGGKDEALVYLYYNETSKDWLIWAPPQKGLGMTVKALPEHENMKQEEEFKGFMRVGTAHHHCNMKAFASGTDIQDEEKFNGLHITVGELESAKLDLHARSIFNGNKFEVDLSYWVALSDRYANIDFSQVPELEEDAYYYSLRTPMPKDSPFPEQWRENFLAGSFLGHAGHASYQGGLGFNGGSSHSRHTSHNTYMSGQVLLGQLTMVSSHPRAVELNAVDIFTRYHEAEKYNAGFNKFYPDSPQTGAYCIGFHESDGRGSSSWMNFEMALNKMKNLLGTLSTRGGTVIGRGLTVVRGESEKNNAEKGEDEVRSMKTNLVELHFIAETLEGIRAGTDEMPANLEQNKTYLELTEILKKYGLNSAWLCKLVDRLELEELARDQNDTAMALRLELEQQQWGH